MIYDHTNSDRSASVIDVEEMERIMKPVAVDTEAATVTVLSGNHSCPLVQICYTSIYPIFGGGTKPCLFHCYGRQP